MSLTKRTLYCIILAVLTGCSMAFAQQYDPCWAIAIDDIDVTPANIKISRIVRASDGFVISGNASQYILPSKSGNAFGRTNFAGPYLAKYDFNGNLIWVDYGIDSQYTSPYSTISSIAVDANDNIYICGKLGSKHKFYYNNGLANRRISAIDTASGTASGLGNFVAKLNKNGHVLWHASLNSTPLLMEYDNHGRIIVGGDIYSSQNKYVVSSDTITTSTVDLSGPAPHSYNFIYWIDTLGILKKAVLLDNAGLINKMSTDNKGNIVVAGKYDAPIKIYSHLKKDSLTVYSLPSSGAGKMFIVKFDSTSKPLWSIRDRNSHVTDLQCGNNGGIYFTTYTNKSFLPHFVNSDSSISYPTYALTRLYSVSKDGKYKWSAGGDINNMNMSGLHVSDSTIALITSNLPGYSYNDTIFGRDSTSHVATPHLSPNLCLALFDTSGTITRALRIGRSSLPKYYATTLDIIGGNDSSLIIYGEATNMFADSAITYHDDTVNFNGADAYIFKSTPGICEAINPPLGRGKISFDASMLDTAMCAKDSFDLPVIVSGEFWSNTEYLVKLGANVSGKSKGTTITSIRCGVPNYFNLPRYNQHITLSVTNPALPDVGPSVENIDIFKPDTPSVTISVTPATVVNVGTPVTFSATTTNAGSNAFYQWQLNGVDIIGANGSIFTTTTVSSNDEFSVWTYSGDKCIFPDTATSNSIHMLTTSLKEVSNNTVKIYPNPSTGSVFLDLSKISGNFTINVFNTIGQLVHSLAHQIGSSITYVDLTSLPSGTYTLQATSMNTTENIRLVIVR